MIGAGPCGIATVGRLVDKGVMVYWIDADEFKVGRMGKFYKSVPANTPNADLLVALRMCKSFNFEYWQSHRRNKGQIVMSDLPLDSCHMLSSFVDALEDSTKSLLSQVTAHTGKVLSLTSRLELETNNCAFPAGSDSIKNPKWTVNFIKSTNISRAAAEVEESLDTIECNAVIYCCGGKPVIPSLQISATSDRDNSEIAVHSMDLLVSPEYVKNLLLTRPELKQEVWAVVGSSHSGMLIVMNLLKAGAERVVNFYRSELRFQHSTEGTQVIRLSRF